jgi:hypothetical protein
MNLVKHIEDSRLVASAREIEKTVEIHIELPDGGTVHVRLEATRQIKGAEIAWSARGYLFDEGLKTWCLLPEECMRESSDSPDLAIEQVLRELIARREALQYLTQTEARSRVGRR